MNKELMDKVRALVSKMVAVVDAHDAGQVEIAGEIIPIDDQVKINMKQTFNALRVDVIKALNDVKLN